MTVIAAQGGNSKGLAQIPAQKRLKLAPDSTCPVPFSVMDLFVTLVLIASSAIIPLIF